MYPDSGRGEDGESIKGLWLEWRGLVQEEKRRIATGLEEGGWRCADAAQITYGGTVQ